MQAPGEPGAEEIASPIPSESGHSDAVGYTRLDPKVIWLWRLSGGLGWSFVLVFLLGTGLGLGGFVWHRLGLTVLVWCGLAVMIVLWLWWYPRRAFAAWGYRLDGRVLELRSGVWFRVVRLLPLSRLQHVDLQRGPLERAFGLASLVLYTAGTHEASIAIPGLADAEAVRLRDTLVAIGGDDGV